MRGGQHFAGVPRPPESAAAPRSWAQIVLEDRAEAGDAGRDPDLAEGRVDARGHAAALVRHDADGGRGKRRIDQADAGPASTKPGISTVQAEVEVSARHRQQATRDSSRPTPSSRRTGMRTLSLPDIGATKNNSSVVGRKRRPACSGL